jgi:elongation factor P
MLSNNMISYSELEKGIQIILDGEPYEIIEGAPMFKGRGHSVFQAKIKNLKTGKVVSQTFHPSDIFEEAKVFKKEIKFLYFHRKKYVFCEKGNPSNRFTLSAEEIGEKINFLKENQIVEALLFENKIINIILPIKIILKVAQAPPGIKAGRAEAGTKQVILETGAKINAPLFIDKGDTIEINTETGEYVRRIE